MNSTLETYEYCRKIPATISIDEIIKWCKDHNSNGDFSVRVGNNQVTLCPSTFQPVHPYPHKLYFEKEQDYVMFLMRWG